MSAIQILSTDKKQVKRVTTSFDKTLAFTQGYYYRITSSSTYTIADVVSAAGVITLPQPYIPGREMLRVYVDGSLLPQPGTDYTEDSPTQLTLASGHVSALNSTTSVIFIEWNRFVPGARDQSLSDLDDVSSDLSAAVRDTGGLRATADATNPLITPNDVGSGSGLVWVPNTGQKRVFWGNDGPTGSRADYSGSVDFSALGSPPSPPSNATHAMVSAILDSDAPAGSGNWILYIAAYDATHANVIDNDNEFCVISTNSTTEVNNTCGNARIVELNSPALAGGDLVFYVDKSPGTGTLDGTAIVRIFVDAWLVTVP